MGSGSDLSSTSASNAEASPPSGRTPSAGVAPTLLSFLSSLRTPMHKDAKEDVDSDCIDEQLPDSPKEVSAYGLLEPDRPVSAGRTVRNILQVAGIFFRDPESRHFAFALGTTLCVCMVFDTLAMAWVSGLFAQLNDALVKKEAEGFYRCVHILLIFLACYLPLSSLEEWLQGAFSLEWRRSITRQLLRNYIGSHQAFYHLKTQASDIDNPDQRIGEDVMSFTGAAVSLFVGMVGSMMKLVAMSGLLLSISGSLFLYLGVGSTVVTVVFLKVFGGPLMRVQRRVLSREATLRFALMRVRENAESIAFYQGAPFELMRVGEIFAFAMSAMYKRLIVFVAFVGTQKAVFIFAQAVPTLAIGPKYLRGEVKFGMIAQTNMLFGILMSSMTSLVAQLGTLTNMGAQATRVQQLRTALDEMAQPPKGGAEGEADMDSEKGEVEESIELKEIEVNDQEQVCLQLADVTLRAPRGGACLVSNLTLTLRRGESVLVCGESGVGKSSLLRAIGGLWDSGSGSISRCAIRRSIFVPQDSYMCLGSLRDNATYPATAEERAEMPDSAIYEALEAANLAYLPHRYGLDAEIDFEGVLSGGEKQRLGFARLLLRPKPLEFAILDEATAALDETNESRLYGLLEGQAYSWASVGHRPHLRKYHTHSLRIERLWTGGTSATFGPIAGDHQAAAAEGPAEASAAAGGAEQVSL